jgi:hypothetical protein
VPLTLFDPEPARLIKGTLMTQQIFIAAFRAGIVALMTLIAVPVSKAQQDTGEISTEWRTYRPDNHAKQKEAISGGTCVVQTGAFPVGFNAYVVPDGDHPSYPPFCSPVPAGPLNLVIDILEQEVREMPLIVNLMKVDGASESEVLSVPATAYKSGNIPLAVNLEPLSKYRILLIGNGDSGSRETLVTIPLDVRRAGDFVHTGNSSMNSSFFLLVVGIAGIVGAAIHFWRPRARTDEKMSS